MTATYTFDVFDPLRLRALSFEWAGSGGKQGPRFSAAVSPCTTRTADGLGGRHVWGARAVGRWVRLVVNPRTFRHRGLNAS
jgi:hypothetical protein